MSLPFLFLVAALTHVEASGARGILTGFVHVVITFSASNGSLQSAFNRPRHW